MKIVTSDDGFDKAAKSLGDNERAAVEAGAKVLQARARAITPKKSGHLTMSLRVASDRNSAVVYSEAVYARKQHERRKFRHTSGQAKFLETALLANQSAIFQAIAERLKLNP